MATLPPRIKSQDDPASDTVFESTPRPLNDVRADSPSRNRATAYVWAVVILAVAGFIAYSVYFAPTSTAPVVTDQSTQTQMAPAAPAPAPDATAPATNSAPPADTAPVTPPATNAAPATPPADTAPATPPATTTAP